MEDLTKEQMLFLPSTELAERWGETYKWENRVEALVEDRIQKYGRSNFDNPHVKAVVNWAKIVGELESLSRKDREILTATAWLHDVGYDFSRAKEEADKLAVVREQKKIHMKVGAEIAKDWYEKEDILNEAFSIEDWEEVAELISQHDEWDRIEAGNHHRLLPFLVAADTLGQIDLRGGVKPSYSKKDIRKYLASSLSNRARVMKGKSGQALIIIVNQYMKELNDKNA